MLHARLRAAAGRDRIPMDYTARFLFEEPSGTGTLIDETGNNNGTYTSCTSVAGVDGQALSVSGSSFDRMDINAAIGNDPSVFALSGWCRLPTNTGRHNLLSHRDDAQALIQIYAENGNIGLQLRSSTSSIVSNATAAAIFGSWFHFVLNFNKSGTTDLYVNDSPVYSLNTPSSGNYSSTLSMIGPYNAGSGFVYLGQQADSDLYTVYGRTLDAAERAALYNEGA